ncbi:MAG TPA: response regulator [Ktedonobacteraceae bacterium]|nr:response regulator [Ktedonobacteraceae bacterium]
MSEQWRILVVEDNEQLNQSIVITLAKDGYVVQGASSGAAAIRLLWSEAYDVVIGNLKTPGADGLELLQWLRAYRPDTRMIMVAASGTPAARSEAYQSGAVSYLEKPLDLHLLKEELRRLLQQTGFSANLDSFDLLDVIQIVTMSRKSIALLVNTGLEERGVLYFQNGELVWAEYGTLLGEEAFFALAAHKNGTVIHQPWQGKITPNVKQPLARLIFQALQYRARYAETSPAHGQSVIAQTPFPDEQDIFDDTPFLVLAESSPPDTSPLGDVPEPGTKEWWQQTGKFSSGGHENSDNNLHALPTDTPGVNVPSIPIRQKKTYPTSEQPSPTRQHLPQDGHSDLPSWLTDQPTKSDLPTLRPSSLSNTAQLPMIPPTPAEWRPPVPSLKPPEQPLQRRTVDLPKIAARDTKDTRERPAASPEWQPGEPGILSSELLQHLTAGGSGDLPDPLALEQLNGSGASSAPRPVKRNYAALVAALQTLGYSITGFMAVAVVGLDGQPIAQVAIDDLDIAPLCKYFSQLLQNALLALDASQWGEYQDTVITSADRHILLRLVGTEKTTFQVLITTHETDPLESLAIMVNVEGAIEAALL